MKNKSTKLWIPLYVDKWIFGSTRIELEPAERGVFVDLMVLAAKDDGFIRANESTPYLPVQIAGILNITPELLASTLEKCVKFGKIVEKKTGIYHFSKWRDYQFSDRYVREVNKFSNENGGGAVPKKRNTCSGKTAPIRKDRIGKERIGKDTLSAGADSIVDNSVDNGDKRSAKVNWERCNTDLQILAAYYLKQYVPDLYAGATQEQANAFFKRQGRALTSICKQSGTIEIAKKVLDLAAKQYFSKNLTWNLDTVDRNVTDFIEQAQREVRHNAQ